MDAKGDIAAVNVGDPVTRGSIDKTDGIEIANNGVVVDHGLHRALKQRHLQMIALGGVIG
jgi:amino acid transporter